MGRCINYANEVLQAHFTATAVREAQHEYQAEGIEVALVEYRDNAAQVSAHHNPKRGGGAAGTWRASDGICHFQPPCMVTQRSPE